MDNDRFSGRKFADAFQSADFFGLPRSLFLDVMCYFGTGSLTDSFMVPHAPNHMLQHVALIIIGNKTTTEVTTSDDPVNWSAFDRIPSNYSTNSQPVFSPRN